MSALTYTCQHDHCTKVGTDKDDFKNVRVQTGHLQFAYILCNEHAKQHETRTP